MSDNNTNQAENNGNSTTNAMEESLTRLCESINQQHQITSIANINIPEFGGGPNEDVTEFLQKFKTVTFSLNDENRCLALKKALVNSARIWAKDNLKEIISVGNWKAAKKAIEKRFQSADYYERYHKKLAAMKYDPKSTTLRSYVEGYVSCFKKAHKATNEKNIIESLVQNLPNNIKYTLNTLSETWRHMAKLSDLYPLITRVEQTILPYAPIEPEPGEKLDVNTMAKLLKQMQEEFKKDCLKEIKAEAKSTQEAVAAIGQIYKPRGAGEDNNAPGSNRNQDNNQNRYRKPYLGVDLNNNQQRRPPQPRPNRPFSFEKNTQSNQSLVKIQEEYYQRFGKPPRPCWHCKQDHFNRHCPYTNLN